MRDYLLKRPMLLCSICCIVISVISFNFQKYLPYVISAISLLIGVMIYKRKDAKLIFMLALIFVMCISCVKTNTEIKELSYYADNSCTSELAIINTNYKSDDFYVSNAEVIKCQILPVGTKLTVFHEPMELYEGTIISGDIKLRSITDKMSGYSEGIYLNGNLKNVKIIDSKYDFVLKFAANTRSYIKNQLFGNIKYEEASTLCALLYGSKDYFTNEFYNCVKAAGVSHIMVVSGLHLSIIVGLFVKLNERIFYNKYVKSFGMIFTVLFLYALCGFTMSILRAGLTYIIMAIGIMLDRKGAPENSLGAAVTLILLFNPYSIFSISFQLSVLSTFGILVIALPVCDYLKNKIKANNKKVADFISDILSIVLATLSATLMTMPVIIKYFGSVSLVSLISNLLLSSAILWAIYAVVFALISGAVFPFLSEILYFPAQIVTQYINFIIKKLGSLPYASIEVPEFCHYIASFIILIVLWGLVACKKRKNMLRLKRIQTKILREGGRKLKWQ